MSHLMTLAPKIDEAIQWLDMNSHHVLIASLSGGADSVAASHLLYLWCKQTGVPFRVMSIDTGLAADNWRSNVSATARLLWDTEVEFVTGGGWAWYEKHAQRFGFGHTPHAHTIYYRMLKERAIMATVKRNKSPARRVVFVTGVRQEESPQRANRPLYAVSGNRVTANLIYKWTKAERDAWLQALCPSYAIPKRSKDCHCNWTLSETCETLATHSPMLAARLQALSDRVVANGRWAYGTRPTATQRAAFAAQPDEDMPEDSFCISCATVNA
jgi:hypothetical protein